MGQAVQILFVSLIVIFNGAIIMMKQIEIEGKLDKLLAELKNNQTKTKC